MSAFAFLNLGPDVAAPPTVPIRRGPTGHLFVSARLGDGRSLELLLDSGASQSVIATSSPALAAAKDVPPAGDMSAEAAGCAVPVIRTVAFDALSIGERNLSGLRLAVLELAQLADRLGRAIDGILGLDVLTRDGFWLDLVNDRISLALRDPASDTATDGPPSHSVDFQVTEHGLIRLDVRTADGISVPAIVDFGAAQTLMNRRALEVLGGEPANGNSAARASAARGADATPHAIAHAHISGLHLGDLQFPRMSVHVAELPVFDVLGYHGRPVVLLGLDLFNRRIVGADFAAKRLHVSAIAA